MLILRSRYACFGLWLIDLRPLYQPLEDLLASHPRHPSLGPLKSYPTVTELTRNPADTRSPMEKNWFLFFPSSGEAFLHYDLSNPYGGARGRTFAKLLGNGLTTVNLTDHTEAPCLYSHGPTGHSIGTKRPSWHQATNSLRLVLCNRSDPTCKPTLSNTVFFTLIHRKMSNPYNLPLRYERYFMVFAAKPPFSIIGISQYPILLANETANGWTPSQNWSDDPTNEEVVTRTKERKAGNATEPYGGKGMWAYFTYTVSISYAWGRPADEMEAKNLGYLDDEVILAIGINDESQGFARVKAGELVQCLQACSPSRGKP